MREVPAAAVSLAKKHEGLHKIVRLQPLVTLAPYVCPAGYWTIGYGHLCKKDQTPIDTAQAKAWLAEDMADSAHAVCAYVPIWPTLTDGQFSALVDFVFNLGSGNFYASTLRRRINEGNFADVPFQFSRWVYGGGKSLPGLVARRADEVRLWLN